ncbi:anti-sigma factor [Chromobacterium sp. ASV23]|uniref:anti-sigma factor family protein n=1 Tax=Chromobacterium sp. ASV23 TaxID=2795110 RepID=UPI0018ED7842
MIEPDEHVLQAYLDGELTADQAAAVAAWLETHPQAAQKLSQWRSQDQALRQLWALRQKEPVPTNLLAAARTAKRRGLPTWLQQGMAAGLVFALGLGGGWYGQQAYQGAHPMAAVDSLPRQAAMAHVVYSPDIQRPVEIAAEQEGQMVAWLSRRMQSRIEPPRLAQAGYELIGGRLLPGNQGPVAQFMYHDASGQRMTLYVARESAPRTDNGFHFASQGPVNVYYWWSKGWGYALSAGMPRERLLSLAEQAQRQITPN